MGGGHKKERPNEAGREGREKQADNNLQQAKRSNELNMKRKMENIYKKEMFKAELKLKLEMG